MIPPSGPFDPMPTTCPGLLGTRGTTMLLPADGCRETGLVNTDVVAVDVDVMVVFGLTSALAICVMGAEAPTVHPEATGGEVPIAVAADCFGDGEPSRDGRDSGIRMRC